MGGKTKTAAPGLQGAGPSALSSTISLLGRAPLCAHPQSSASLQASTCKRHCQFIGPHERFASRYSAYGSLAALRLRELTNVCGCLAPVRAPALQSVKRLLTMGHSNGLGAPTAIYLSPAAPSTFSFMRSIFTWQLLAIGLNGSCSHPFREGPASERARHTTVNCELPVKNRPVGGREPASSGEQLVGTG